MTYIIDGYNVMYALNKGVEIEADELDEKRRSFIEAVVNHTALTRDEAVIVFDSRLMAFTDHSEIAGTAVSVYFAAASESADIVIGKLVQQHLAGSRELIRVVSADWEVQKGAMQARVERVPPRNYIAEIKNFKKGLANNREKGRIHQKLEDKLDVETLRKLEEMRDRSGEGSE